MNENYKSYILEYNNKIKTGEIIVGVYIKLMLEILVGYFTDDNIIINFTDAEKRINFIENECVHVQAPFAGKPFKLELFQKVIVEALYSFFIYDEELKRNVRLFQKLLLVIGRKNGKSPFISALSLAEWVCGEMGTNILFGSNDYDQAGILFDATNDMREECTKLNKCTHKNQKGIFWGNKGRKIKRGKFSSQNKGSIKKLSARTTTKEGKNIKIGAVDEVHELQDNKLIMPIRQALSTQDEPLYLEITTEGFIDNGYLDEEMEEAKNVLTGAEEDKRWLIFIYQQDSEEEIWQDEKSWYKSNPGLGVIKKWSFLRQMVEESKKNRGTKAFVLAKDFNIKQNGANTWLDLDTIINLSTFDIKDFEGQYYIGALDFAETTDLCNAKAMFYNPKTKLKYILSMYFIPESKADAILEDETSKLNPEKKNYRDWQKKGLVIICPGNEVDASQVADFFKTLYNDYKMVPFKIGYDNWHSKDFRSQISNFFGEEVLERIDMNYKCVSDPMYLLEADLKSKVLIYNNNEMDVWCLKNTQFKPNDLAQIMPIKKYGQSKNRIDGTLGFIILEATFQRFKSDYITLQS